MLWEISVLPLLYLGLLPPVLADMKTAAVEDNLCRTVPCVFEFPKAYPRNPMAVGYRLNGNISVRADTSHPRAPTGDLSTEEEDCILLTGDVLGKGNTTYLLYVGLGDQKGTILRESTRLSMPDLTQKPELHTPESGVAGEPATLTCSVQGTCQVPRVPFLSWNGPDMAPNTSVSITSSSELSTLRCHLSLSLENLTSRKVVKLQLVSPPRLLNYSCLLKKTLACSCSFHGTPIPSVQWWVGGTPVSANSIDTILRTTTTTLEPWTNSTIHLMWEPEIIGRLRCEGRNQYGVHASRIFLIPEKSSISSVFLRGLIQGFVYGTIASSLLLLFLVVLAMKILNWWEENQTCKNKEAPTLKKPVLGGAKMAEV
ncbi:sialic acid-binding Ig-like lectin 11 isoform X2 [Mesocricetus auratus]|uniref:Sialic acid-binding Ig-like lectin 11 isoform X2 n=1 Tax=Mesocricetus auratus TaxID=10036 RepID=A0ABM2WS09_MESAU|nr:sialic acid-binding Ig-like lectin 11 isoform X2 [Mesocricetus auratus]